MPDGTKYSWLTRELISVTLFPFSAIRTAVLSIIHHSLRHQPACPAPAVPTPSIGGSSVVRISVAPNGIIEKSEAPPETRSSTGARDAAKTPCPGLGAGTARLWNVNFVSLLMFSAGRGPVVLSVMSHVKVGVRSASGNSPLALHSVSRWVLQGAAYEYSSGPVTISTTRHCQCHWHDE